MHNNRIPIIGYHSYCFAPGCGMKREEEETIHSRHFRGSKNWSRESNLGKTSYRR